MNGFVSPTVGSFVSVRPPDSRRRGASDNVWGNTSQATCCFGGFQFKLCKKRRCFWFLRDATVIQVKQSHHFSEESSRFSFSMKICQHHHYFTRHPKKNTLKHVAKKGSNYLGESISSHLLQLISSMFVCRTWIPLFCCCTKSSSHTLGKPVVINVIK